MPAQQIQVPAETPSWQQRIQLDGQDYYLSCTLNERLDRFFFSLSDATQTPIIEGRKILAGRDLLRGIGAMDRRPPGMMFAMDFSGAKRHPTYANFGTEVVLIYVPVDEVP